MTEVEFRKRVSLANILFKIMLESGTSIRLYQGLAVIEFNPDHESLSQVTEKAYDEDCGPYRDARTRRRRALE